jgi:hypothetical protein
MDDTSQRQAADPPGGPPPLVLLERDEATDATPPSVVPAAPPPPPPPAPAAPPPTPTVEQPSDRPLAILLGAAAILAAVLGAHASFLANDSSAAWQQAVRIEVKHAAAMVEDVRFVYGDEAPQAYRVLEARVRSKSFSDAADSATREIQAVLLAEAFTHEQVAAALEPSSELARDARYRLPDGSVDVARRLADQRATSPDLVALDPEAAQASGDRFASHALLVLAAALPLGFTFLLGALARAFPRGRRSFLLAGTAALVGSLVAALAVELVA